MALTTTAPAPLGRPPVAGRRVGRAARRAARALGEVALTLAALAGLGAMAVTVAAVRAEVRPLVVRTGSMAPTVPAGSMVLVRRVNAAELRPGEVVAARRADGTTVLHRIVAIDRDGPTAMLTLRGDANQDVDPQPVAVVAADRLVWQVPAAGRAAAWLATAPGGFALGCLVTALSALVLRRRPR